MKRAVIHYESFPTMKILKLTPILLLLTLTHANNFKYNDPNTWNISLPESILQYLDYIDAIEPSTIFRNVSALDDEICNQDYLSIFKDLRENYQWPKVMLDAGNTASPGLLDGNRIVIGNYDECLSVSPPNRNFTGKHCLVYINDSVDPFEMDAVGFYWFRRPIFYIGVCIPSTCSAKYINKIVNEILIPFSNQTFSDVAGLGVSEEDCHTINETKEFTTLNWITISVLTILAACLILSTFYDWYCRVILKNDKPSKLLLAFSVPKNLSQIFNIGQSNRISSIAGIKAVTAIYIVFAHSYYLEINGNAENFRSCQLSVNGELYGNLMVNHGLTATDTFLLLSGILVVFSFLNEVKRKSQYDPGSALIKRYLRLISPVAFILLIQLGILDQFYTGPIYKIMNKFFRNGCKGHIWSILLVFNNFVQTTTQMCNQHFWYIAVDLQLFLASQLLLVIALWSPKKSAQLAGILCWGFAFMEFIIAYINDMGPIPTMDRGNLLKLDYSYPHTRSAPWLAGMFLGFWLHKNNKKPLKLTRIQALIWWTICVFIMWATLYPLTYFKFSNYHQPWSAIYVAFRRISWSFSIGLVLILCYNDYGGYINKILTWGPLKFYDKIALELFLVHIPCIEFIIASEKNMIYMSFERIFYIFFTFLPMSTVIAIVLALTVTAPINIIIQLLLPNLKLIPIKSHWEKIDKTEAVA